MQLVLPGWVRARGMAIYVVIFMGSQTAGALTLGAHRQPVRPPARHPCSGRRGASRGSLPGLIWRLPETGHLDPQPAVYWSDPRVAFDPEPRYRTRRSSLSISPSRRSVRPSSWLRWISSGYPDSEPVRPDGSCTETLNIAIASSRSSARLLLGRTPPPTRGAPHRNRSGGRGGRRWLSPIPRCPLIACYPRSGGEILQLQSMSLSAGDLLGVETQACRCHVFLGCWIRAGARDRQHRSGPG